ncbi:rhodanese-like domain-containing protein [Spirulina sp. 06S082]|uniref:rhodanese-like domain-containing protein n=1 Tax=Spirulina sp. 06S082 TaxID=3110248 RepID=UPI002B1F8256|nr:rhodanese-like domain-containing protein [Spirulina sp. 06S082]MEA5468378.1 rhodanese-like domain-containing protein [Spirulina sp. 06S082]
MGHGQGERRDRMGEAIAMENSLVKFFSAKLIQSRKALLLLCLGVFMSITGAIATRTVFNPSIELAAFNFSDIPLVTVAELRRSPAAQKLAFIDVRTPQEYQRDRIQDSFLVPISAIEQGSGVEQVRQIAAQNPHSTLVLYCQRGPRSYRAYQHLEKTGLNFIVLSGGITAWRKVVLE